MFGQNGNAGFVLDIRDDSDVWLMQHFATRRNRNTFDAVKSKTAEQMFSSSCDEPLHHHSPVPPSPPWEVADLAKTVFGATPGTSGPASENEEHLGSRLIIV